MKEQLNRIADQIEMVLARNESPARVSGGVVTPRWIRFDLCPAFGVRAASIQAAAEQLAAELGMPARVIRDNGTLTLEAQRTDAQPISLADMLARLPAVPFGTAVLGIADDGAPLLLRLPSPEVGHVAIVGDFEQTAALAQTIAVSLMALHKPHELQIAGARPSELIDLARKRNEQDIARPLVVCLVDVNRLSSVIERSALEVLTVCGHSVGVHVVARARDEAMLGCARFGVRLVDLEPGYFAAESGAGVVNFTAAQVRGELCQTDEKHYLPNGQRDLIERPGPAH